MLVYDLLVALDAGADMIEITTDLFNRSLFEVSLKY